MELLVSTLSNFLLTHVNTLELLLINSYLGKPSIEISSAKELSDLPQTQDPKISQAKNETATLKREIPSGRAAMKDSM